MATESLVETVSVADGLSLDDYAGNAHLASAVADLRAEARALVPVIAKRKIWMINSTAKGGGVAEMLPTMVSVLRDLGLDVEWLTITPGDDAEAFFSLTKKLHNLIHGLGEPSFSDEERSLYREVSTRLADELEPRLDDGDVLVIHDPQPAGVGALLEERNPALVSIWRCHIGLDEDLPETRAAWDFLRPFVGTYDHAVFSAPEYIPPFLAGKSTIIAPAIDPLTAKNQRLSAHALVGILCNSGLMTEHQPVLRPDYAHQAQRLGPDGAFHAAIPSASDGDEVGMLYRPIVTQISRWDRLKGWFPLLEGFALLKRSVDRMTDLEGISRRRLELVRLILAGPDPASVQDDPEGKEVLDELIEAYRGLEPAIQQDVALLSLPMESRRENALMVNALQRCSSVVVQNSIREGFGLTATEAMWKRTPVMASTACGLRQQVRDQIDGRMHSDATDAREIAELLVEMLGAVKEREQWGRNAELHVYDEFLIFAQMRKWLRLLARAKGGTVEPARSPASLPPEVD